MPWRQSTYIPIVSIISFPIFTLCWVSHLKTHLRKRKPISFCITVCYDHSTTSVTAANTCYYWHSFSDRETVCISGYVTFTENPDCCLKGMLTLPYKFHRNATQFTLWAKRVIFWVLFPLSPQLYFSRQRLTFDGIKKQTTILSHAGNCCCSPNVRFNTPVE